MQRQRPTPANSSLYHGQHMGLQETQWITHTDRRAAFKDQKCKFQPQEKQHEERVGINDLTSREGAGLPFPYSFRQRTRTCNKHGSSCPSATLQETHKPTTDKQPPPNTRCSPWLHLPALSHWTLLTAFLPSYPCLRPFFSHPSRKLWSEMQRQQPPPANSSLYHGQHLVCRRHSGSHTLTKKELPPKQKDRDFSRRKTPRTKNGWV